MGIEKHNLPVGRIVGGNPAVAQEKTNFQTKQAVLDKDGKKVQQWRCEIAYPKDVFLREIWPLMVREAATAYPVNPQTGLPNVNRDFSWKYVDGDSTECPKNSKVAYNAREGYPGHYVLKISTEAFAPKIWKQENGGFFAVEPHQIKTGDYVVANVDIKVHANNDGGLYINPNTFCLVGYGAAIASQGGVNPEQAFGGQNYQLPPGASAMPTTPMTPPAPMAPAYGPAPIPALPQAPQAPVYQQPAMPAAPMAPAYQQPMPMAPQPPYAAPAQLPPPAHDFVQNLGAPQGYPQPVAPQPAMPMAPAAPAYAAPVPTMPAAGYGVAPVSQYPSNGGMPPLPPTR